MVSSEKKPEIAVVITNYNYGKYLNQAIQSVLAQTYRAIKLFVIDDASTDDSRTVLNKYRDRATIVRHVRNKGIVYTRNEALSLVSSPYVLFLDADNWFEPNHVAALVETAIENKADVVYCGMQYYAEDKEGVRWIPPEYDIERLKNENYIDSSSLVRLAAVHDIRFDPMMEKLTHEDWDFFLAVALTGASIKLTKKTYLNYRVKSDRRNITNADSSQKFVDLYKYLYEKYAAQYPDKIGYLAYYRFIKSYSRLAEKLASVQSSVGEFHQVAERIQGELDAVRGSGSYRIGRFITFLPRTARRVFGKFSAAHLVVKYKHIIQQTTFGKATAEVVYRLRNVSYAQERYFLERDGAFKKKSNLAVILHLYYTENWEQIFRRKLLFLTSHASIDLYITMTPKDKNFIETIRRDFPDANIFFAHNKGRDVLPFIKAVHVLSAMGYKKVLKIHSKKSTHRDIVGNSAESGSNWLKKMLDALVPEDSDEIKAIINKVSEDTTGIIGTQEYCYPMKMYLDHNRLLIERIMASIDRTFFMGEISQKLDKMSYFGGTMFWIDIQAIQELLNISKRNFQKEQGQTDGTTAHALERLFSLLPQLRNKNNYVVSRRGRIRPLSNQPTYPDWYYDDLPAGEPCVSIVVPVYADWQSLSKNIRSLKKYFAGSEIVSVHYVNDCGPDADNLEQKIRRHISGLSNFYYYRNPQNLGFVRTCNRASLELVSQRDDVLLLNSDTKVTKNFAYEMRKVLYAQPNIGAVTSRSNNATIWSVPMTSRLANHRWASYLLYRVIKHKLPLMYITPTIHGFCVLIRREVISQYGLFDEIYGKGYGEENDFAMRITNNGWSCAAANYAYVFHYESRSFGNEVRNAQIEKNEKILLERYPKYRMLVQEYWDSIKEPLK